MNIDKFEYWAKRQGMSCVKFKDNKGGIEGYSTYTSAETERAFIYWLDAFSPQVQSAFEAQQVLKEKYKGVAVENEFIIEAVNLTLEEFFDETKDLKWLYKFSMENEADNHHVLQVFRCAKRSCERNITKLSSLIKLQDLFIWKTRDDYPRIRAKVSDALKQAAEPVFISGAVEADIALRLNGIFLLKRGDMHKDSREYKFSDRVIELAIKLSEKETHESN